MKVFASTILMSLLTAGATGAFAAVTGDWVDNWYRTKLGRSSPAEESRIRADQANTAFREVTSDTPAPNPFQEQWYRAKFGRSTPEEEARRNAEAQNTAFRQDATAGAPENRWFQDWRRAKHGRQ